MALAVGCSVEGVRKYLLKHEIPYTRVRGTRPGTDLGARHPNWKGGRKKRGEYIVLLRKDHPQCDYRGYVAEHRLVMEGMIGRFLLPGEVVHHKDGDKHNNAPENLQLFASNAEHMSFELTGVPKSEAHRQHISDRQKGRTLPKEWAENIRKAVTGRKLSPEACQNISDGKRRFWASEKGAILRANRAEAAAERQRNLPPAGRKAASSLLASGSGDDAPQ